MLPSVHKLAHILINNILIPKAKIKSNIDFFGLFYLRHLIALDGLEFHIPYIILRYMRIASSYSRQSLPYGHIIQWILSIHDVNLPGDTKLLEPINICDKMTSFGWIEEETNGVSWISADDRPINAWIWHENATPNQYWNPKLKNVRVETSSLGESVYRNTMENQVSYIAQQIGNLTTEMTNMQEMIQMHQIIADERYRVMSSKMENIEAVQTGFFQRFNRHFPKEDNEDD